MWAACSRGACPTCSAVWYVSRPRQIGPPARERSATSRNTTSRPRRSTRASAMTSSSRRASRYCTERSTQRRSVFASTSTPAHAASVPAMVTSDALAPPFSTPPAFMCSAVYGITSTARSYASSTMVRPRRSANAPRANRARARSRYRVVITASYPTPMTSPFVPGTSVRIAGAPGGPLAGVTFAAKDLFDVAGHPTGGGNPDWAKSHPVPVRHAWAVQRLLDAGATLVGKTITDEISLGILGENPFDGTALNPKAPDRVPGGSSSGSASAVAQGLCDTALGTDTGGSVRVPASFCGLYGIRPTHGRLDLSGMMAQAPRPDTPGGVARHAGAGRRGAG